jgi:demethylmenaquinone methyltransferase/2-methoxy-6-polyprenyl-1,4-benzoquinol methylase
MLNDDKLKHYYACRAAEYEQIYDKPERQSDLQRLREYLGQVFAGRDVLEIACGTGYWTQIIAQSARSIAAVDYAQEPLTIARAKDYGDCPVTFIVDDAYSLAQISDQYNAAFCGFWWSHVPQNKLSSFLHALHSKLPTDALVVMLDNSYVEGSSTPISDTDADGNTYQIRTLGDGTEHEVMKNFPSREFVREMLMSSATGIEIMELVYYWLVAYRAKRTGD